MEQNAPEQAAWPRMTRIFTVSLGLMMFEITLVRLFSVIMWYHLAFFVLAIALFGFGLGGLYAQIWRRGGKGAAEPGRLHAFLPIFIACAIVSALVLLVLLPLNTASEMYQVPRIRWILCAFLIAAAPFFFGSIYMAQLFAARPAEAGRLYFADLLGAGAPHTSTSTAGGSAAICAPTPASISAFSSSASTPGRVISPRRRLW